MRVCVSCAFFSKHSYWQSYVFAIHRRFWNHIPTLPLTQAKRFAVAWSKHSMFGFKSLQKSWRLSPKWLACYIVLVCCMYCIIIPNRMSGANDSWMWQDWWYRRWFAATARDAWCIFPPLLILRTQTNLNLTCAVLVAHKIYGIPQTINSGNYVYFLAYQELIKLRSLISSSSSNQPHSVCYEIYSLSLLHT